MALVRLYEVTKKKKYLDLAAFFINQRGTKPYYFDTEGHPKESIHEEEGGLRYAYNQAHLPVREQSEAVGHAVRAVYLYSGMADVARLKKMNACLLPASVFGTILWRKSYILLAESVLRTWGKRFLLIMICQRYRVCRNVCFNWIDIFCAQDAAN